MEYRCIYAFHHPEIVVLVCFIKKTRKIYLPTDYSKIAGMKPNVFRWSDERRYHLRRISTIRPRRLAPQII